MPSSSIAPTRLTPVLDPCRSKHDIGESHEESGLVRGGGRMQLGYRIWDIGLGGGGLESAYYHTVTFLFIRFAR